MSSQIAALVGLQAFLLNVFRIDSQEWHLIKAGVQIFTSLFSQA